MSNEEEKAERFAGLTGLASRALSKTLIEAAPDPYVAWAALTVVMQGFIEIACKNATVEALTAYRLTARGFDTMLKAEIERRRESELQ